MHESRAQDASPLQKLEKHVRTLDVVRHARELEREPRDSVIALKYHITEAARAARDAMSLDDVRKQRSMFAQAIKELEEFRAQLLLVSQFDLIGPVDVAQLSVMSEQAIEDLNS